MGRIGRFLSKNFISVTSALCATLTVLPLKFTCETIVESSSLSAGWIESEEGFDILVDFPRRVCINDEPSTL